MNYHIHPSFKLLGLLSTLAVAAPTTLRSTGQPLSILSRADSSDGPYIFPVGGIIAIPLAVLALVIVAVGLVRRKFRKPSTEHPPISLVERTRTNTLPPYQPAESSPEFTSDSRTTSTSSSGPAKPQDLPPAYVPPPTNSTAPNNSSESNNSTGAANSTTPQNQTGGEPTPGNGQAP